MRKNWSWDKMRIWGKQQVNGTRLKIISDGKNEERWVRLDWAAAGGKDRGLRRRGIEEAEETKRSLARRERMVKEPGEMSRDMTWKCPRPDRRLFFYLKVFRRYFVREDLEGWCPGRTHKNGRFWCWTQNNNNVWQHNAVHHARVVAAISS
jgi:hypothetical protein